MWSKPVGKRIPLTPLAFPGRALRSQAEPGNEGVLLSQILLWYLGLMKQNSQKIMFLKLQIALLRFFRLTKMPIESLIIFYIACVTAVN